MTMLLEKFVRQGDFIWLSYGYEYVVSATTCDPSTPRSLIYLLQPTLHPVELISELAKWGTIVNRDECVRSS